MLVNQNSVWVFDLDDTLYSERDYQLSGYNFIKEEIKALYGRDLSLLIKNTDLMGKDVFLEICKALDLPESFKESLLWMYRLHSPSITLSKQVYTTLEYININCAGMAIITDGRGVTQRKKLLSLGLLDVISFISEEWSESKPGLKRFEHIEQMYPDSCAFVYVGDNVTKDFVTPNKLNWLTIGIRDQGKNIHTQDITEVREQYLPQLWVDYFSEIKKYVNGQANE